MTAVHKMRVLVADDDPSARTGPSALFRSDGFDVVVAEDGEDAIARIRESAPDVVVTDLRMPRVDGFEVLRQARERNGLAPVASELHSRVTERLHLDSIIGKSPAMHAVFDVVRQVAPSRANVLITGESGTGKELVARAIHEYGPRARAPFVKLHCAALAESILESELFGHEKGAFTGAAGRREGRFKQADGGTFFLDEIGEMSPAIQVKLLRFLQERTFERVGGNESLKVDLRVIAATNRDLPGKVAEGRFREDLFYRLNVVNVEMPPLRARPSDIQPLATHFLERFARENGKAIGGFDGKALAQIVSYRWPGNVRELENVIERAVVLCEGPVLTAQCLPVSVGVAPRGSLRIPGFAWAEIERHAILAALDVCEGSTSKAAQMLDVSIRKVQYKLQDYGITMQRTASVRPPARA